MYWNRTSRNPIQYTGNVAHIDLLGTGRALLLVSTILVLYPLYGLLRHNGVAGFVACTPEKQTDHLTSSEVS